MEREAKIDIKEALYEQETEDQRMETSERLKENMLAAAEQEEKLKSDFLRSSAITRIYRTKSKKSRKKTPA